MLFKSTTSLWEHLMETLSLPNLSTMELDTRGRLQLLLKLWMIQISINFWIMRNILLMLFTWLSWKIYWTAMIICSIFLVVLLLWRDCIEFKNPINSTLTPGPLGLCNTNFIPITVTWTAAKKGRVSALVCCWSLSYCTLIFIPPL